MNFTGRYVIPAPAEAVWAALNDPEVLKYCIPGCEEIEKTSPTDFIAVATLKIGPVKAKFRGKVALSDLDPPYRCKLSGEGQGGVAGFAKGGADVELTPDDGGTVLVYTAQASVGGKLAQIGQRLIDGAAKQIADDFFGRFSQAIAAAAQAPTPVPAFAPDPMVEPAAPSPSQPLSPAPPNAKREGRATEIWMVGLVGVVVILLLIFGAVL
ncbi:MAG: carbon monoxide dehydrogenase subunit G [Alphaproteobacteria bacterium]|nr:carbon monoxide dehydrogenase subunit G [Alphaproteobacteria bacterium]